MFNYAAGPINAQGAFTADFALPAALPLDQVSAIIERDRMIMATRPGMRQKHLPFRLDQSTGNFFSGGRYLFDTFENAAAYKSWLEHEFVLDGVKFFEQPHFLNPVYYTWQVLGAYDFKDIYTSHVVVRSERWDLSRGNSRASLEQAWPLLQDEAARRNLASVWLLYSEERGQAGLVTVADRVGANNPAALDTASLSALESAEALGHAFERQGWAKKTFDRTSWVWTIWFPHAAGEKGLSLWPNSPALPAPVSETVLG